MTVNKFSHIEIGDKNSKIFWDLMILDYFYRRFDHLFLLVWYEMEQNMVDVWCLYRYR